MARDEPLPPLRRLSQNFLVDAGVAARIVAALGPLAEDHVLEIGPGRGALTGHLAERAGRVVAIELDRGLADRLARSLAGLAHVRVVHGDVLATPFESLREGPRLRVVANLPYGISSAVVLKLLDETASFRDAVLMFQREFAERLAAGPGTRAYGSLSALAQTRVRVRHLFDVPPGAFKPRPSVHSSVVHLEPLATPLVATELAETLALLLRMAFSGRRKTLANALARGLGVSREQAAGLLEAAGLDAAARAETVAPAAWARLAETTRLHPALVLPGTPDISTR